VAFVFEAVASQASGGLAPIATNLAYPIADALLIAIVIGVLAVRSWSIDQGWLLIGAGFGVFAVSDSAYLLRVAAGSYQYGTWLDLGWLAGFVLLANAAWTKPSQAAVRAFEGRRVFILPAFFALCCLALVIVDHFRSLSTYGIALVWLALGFVVVRMALTFEEHLELVSTFRIRSLTDPLTLLGNRRAMLMELSAILESEPLEPHLLLLFDLNGFKNYNDTYGHLAGDALLHRLGVRLQSAVSGRGSAFRLGGDEFCVILPGTHQDLEWARAATAASLRESGEGFTITCAIGHAELPADGRAPDDVLRVADHRMYASKEVRLTDAESTRVLVQALAERDQGLGTHIGKVARLAALTASAAGLTDAEANLARLAAELHDVGKLAIPENILAKPGPLDADEWQLVRQHTLIGQRIIAAAPGLESVAQTVRSSHERWPLGERDPGAGAGDRDLRRVRRDDREAHLPGNDDPRRGDRGTASPGGQAVRPPLRGALRPGARSARAACAGLRARSRSVAGGFTPRGRGAGSGRRTGDAGGACRLVPAARPDEHDGELALFFSKSRFFPKVQGRRRR
jgi:diguanylate cyclase (GGDEF)-like protein